MWFSDSRILCKVPRSSVKLASRPLVTLGSCGLARAKIEIDAFTASHAAAATGAASFPCSHLEDEVVFTHQQAGIHYVASSGHFFLRSASKFKSF